MLNSSFHCAQQRKAIAAIGPAREAAVGGGGEVLQPVGISLVQIEEKIAKEIRTCLQLPLLSLLMRVKRKGAKKPAV